MSFDLSFVNKENVQNFIDAFQNDGKIDNQEAQKLKIDEQIQKELNNAFASGELTIRDFVQIQNTQTPTAQTNTQNKVAKNHAAKVAKEKENAQVFLKMNEIKVRIDKLISDALDPNNHEYNTRPQKQEILNLFIEIKEIRLQGLNFTTLTAEQQEVVEQCISKGTDRETAIFNIKKNNGDYEIKNFKKNDKEFEEFVKQSVDYILSAECDPEQLIDDISNFVNKESTKKLFEKQQQQKRERDTIKIQKHQPIRSRVALQNAEALIPGLGKKLESPKVDDKKAYEQWEQRGY